jgi:hypothetical protein
MIRKKIKASYPPQPPAKKAKTEASMHKEKKKKCEKKATEPPSTTDATSDTILQSGEAFVQGMNRLGSRLMRAKSTNDRLHLVNDLTKSELQLFASMISHLWGQQKTASDLFDVASEDLEKFSPYLTQLKEFSRSRTSLKRRRAILQEGHLLKHLAEFMSQLAFEDDRQEKKAQFEEEKEGEALA